MTVFYMQLQTYNSDVSPYFVHAVQPVNARVHTALLTPPSKHVVLSNETIQLLELVVIESSDSSQQL